MISSDAIARHEPEEWPTDMELQRRVREELECSSEVDASRIGVSANHGVVHLDGEVADAAHAAAARKAALRVRGTAGLVDGLEVSTDTAFTDDALVERVTAALRHAECVPPAVRATARHGVVTLSGSARSQYEQELAARTVEHLAGIRGLVNEIGLAERPSAAETAARVREALLGTASADAGSIVVRVDGTEVVLEGTVHSYAERQHASRAAWSSPHVTQVHNRIHLLF